MRRKRWIIAVLVLVISTAAFSGCGKGENQASSSSTPQSSASPTASPQPLSAAEEWESVPSGSLLFLNNYGYSPNLYAINADGSGLTQLTDSPESDRPGGFSPDGKLFAYSSWFRDDGQPDGLYVMSLDDSNEHLVARDGRSGEYATDPRTAVFVSWSPQGRIQYVQATHQICRDDWISNADGSDAVRISRNSAFGGLAWSHDGENAVLAQCNFDRYASQAFDSCSLSIVGQDGEPVRTLIQDNPGMFRSIGWSPNGREVVFINGDKAGTISVADATGGTVRTLYQSPADSQLDDAEWSSDGSHIISAASNEILMISTTDGSVRTIANGTDFSTTPDGSRIVVRNGTEIDVVSLEDGTSNPVATGTGFLMSPDGLKIAVRNGSEIDVVSLVDGTSQTVATGGDFDRTFFWSPTSDKLAYLTPESLNSDETLSIVSTDSGERKDIAFHLSYGFISWSPDGRQIIFASDHERRRGVWWVSPDGSDEGHLDLTSKGVQPPDKPTVAGVVGGCRAGPDNYSCLSPDGKIEALVLPDSKVLTLKDLASSTTRDLKIEGADADNASPVWSNDGTKIAVHARDHGHCQLSSHGATGENSDGCKIYVVDVATGDAWAIEQDATPGEYSPAIAWSPDDGYVYYVKGTECLYGCMPGLLYRVHPDGTGEERVADIRVDMIYGFKP